MSEKRCVLVVHAHPDDEVFRTAGIFAKYAAAGDRVVVVYATRGELGEMHDPDRKDVDDARARLGEIREEEVREACALLGVTELHFLGYRDSGMKESEANQDPRAFINAPIDEAAGRLVEIMRETRPQVVVTYDEHGERSYGHPDHVMVNRITVEAFHRARKESWGPQKLYYGASSREAFRRWVEGLREIGLTLPWLKNDFNFDDYGMLDSEITAHIDISAYVPLKKRALAMHRTQIPEDFFYLSIPDEALARASGVEYFVREFPPATPGEREDDLFAGVHAQTAAAEVGAP